MLKDLAITGFRGFDTLRVDHLGAVNLIVGKNGVGKTSLLESVWLYSAPMNRNLVSELLSTRQEFQYPRAESPEVDFSPLFYGGRSVYRLPLNASIGPSSGGDLNQAKFRLANVSITPVSGSGQSRTIAEVTGAENIAEDVSASDEVLCALIVEFGGSKSFWFNDSWARRASREGGFDQASPFLRFSKDNSPLAADWWRSLALTDSESRVVDLMSLVCPVDRLSYVGAETGYSSSRQVGRDRFLVRLKGAASPQPLKSLGDGAERVFQTALAIEYARLQASKAFGTVPTNAPFNPGWCVLIDEIDSGIHYSILEAYWDAVFALASQTGVQIFATTHSRECIEGFQRSALRCEDLEGVAIRLEQVKGGVRAVTIAEDDLTTVVEAGIEIR